MNPITISKVLGIFVLIFSTGMIAPMVVAWIYGEAEWLNFLFTMLVLIAVGLLLWLPNRNRPSEVHARDGFVIVASFWLVLGLLGTLPFLFSTSVDLSLTDAFFESTSALTTTGATVMSGLDFLPKSILFYRQLLQWFGGMGIIVLAVAVLPMLGIGGMQLFRAETPGPNKDNKLTPRITETAKSLWYLYITFTAICALAYWYAGMSLFDAICHSFTTIATAGMSPHDASMGYFNNAMIEWIAIFFMFISGITFATHFLAFRRGSLWVYFRDEETVTYFAIVVTAISVIWLTLVVHDINDNSFQVLRQTIFQVVSYLTTTGYSTTDISLWPFHISLIVVSLSFFGACAGSTAGGMKIVRIIIATRQVLREIYQLIHPRAIFSVKLNNQPVEYRVIQSVWVFLLVHLVIFFVLMQILLITGMDFITAYSTAASAINNLGPALGEAVSNWSSLNSVAKWLLSLAMIMGRLEIFTLLVLLTPMFWRK